ncbi:MAG: DMT family transporter [Brevinema sp.]
MNTVTTQQARKGTIFLYLAAFLWGSTFIFQKLLLTAGVMPFYMAGIRFSFVVVTLFFTPWHKIPKHTWKQGSILGTFLFFAFATQAWGLKTLDSSVSAFLTGMVLIFAPILTHVIDKHPITIINVLAVASAFTGVYFFNLDGNSHFVWNIGTILTIICALGYAVHLVIAARFLKTSNPLELNVVQSIMCAILGYVFGFIFREPFPVVWSPISIGSILYLGLIGSILCYALQSMGQKLVKSVIKVSLILALEPLFAVLLAVPILGETIGLIRFTGMFLIFGGILLSELQSIREHKKSSVLNESKSDKIG